MDPETRGPAASLESAAQLTVLPRLRQRLAGILVAIHGAAAALASTLIEACFTGTSFGPALLRAHRHAPRIVVGRTRLPAESGQAAGQSQIFAILRHGFVGI